MSAKTKILIVEHDPYDIELIQSELKKENINYIAEIVETENTYEAALRDFLPDIILSDYTLPSFDGPAAFAIKEKISPHTPFIFVSGTIGEEKSIELIKNGVTDYVLKDRLFTLPTKVNRALKEAKEKKESNTMHQELIHSERQLAKAQKVAHLGSWDLNFAIGIALWSDEACRIYGLPIEENKHTFEDWISFIHPEDLDFVLKKVKEFQDSLRDTSFHHRIIRKDGTIRHIYSETKFEFDSKGKPTGLYGVVNDVTEKKQAEGELIEKEFFLKESQRAGNIGSYKLNFATGYWQSSETLDTIFGIDKNYDRSIPGWLEIVHPDDRQNMDEYLRLEVIGKRKSFNKEYRIVRNNDKQTKWVYGMGDVKFDNNGNITDMIGTAQDITERKNGEELLRQSEINLRAILENTDTGFYLLDSGANIIAFNKKVNQFAKLSFGFELQEKQNLIKQFAPERQQQFADIFSETIKGTNITYEINYPQIDGTIIWYSVSGNQVHNSNGKVVGVCVAVNNITEKKHAEDELKKLAMVAKETINGVIIRDKDQNVLWVNNAFTKMWGYELDEVIGKNPLQFLRGHETDVEVVNYVTEQLMKKKPFVCEILYYTKAGDKVYVSVQLQPIFDDNGDVKQFFALQTDITEKKHAEDELKKLSMVAKETINGVVISDKDQNVVWVNNAFIKMYGYELDEIIGKHPGQFLRGPETEIEDVNYVQEKIMQKEPFTFEILNYNKAGDKVYVKVQVQPIFDEKGDVKQFFALQTDITKQRELEEKVELEKIIKQKQITDAVFAAHENERSEIGRELHDNVNQLLGATRLYIDMARKDEENRDSLLTNAATFTLTAIEEIRKLSKTLITPLINEIGLTDSIKDLAEEIMLVHPIQILFTKDFIEDELNDKFKLTVFRIVQEQINNILKHAQAKTININIEENYGKLLLLITDDGIGFDTAKRKTGVGLTNIKTRTGLYNGTMLLNSEQGKGTALSITFNKTDLLLNDHNESDS